MLFVFQNYQHKCSCVKIKNKKFLPIKLRNSAESLQTFPWTCITLKYDFKRNSEKYVLNSRIKPMAVQLLKNIVLHFTFWHRNKKHIISSIKSQKQFKGLWYLFKQKYLNKCSFLLVFAIFFFTNIELLISVHNLQVNQK